MGDGGKEYRGEKKILWKQERGVGGNHSQALIGIHLYFLESPS